MEVKFSNITGFRGQQILIHNAFLEDVERLNDYAKDNQVVLIINHSFRPSNKILNNTVVQPAKLSNHYVGFALDFNIVTNKEKIFANELDRDNLNNLPMNVQSFINDIRQDKRLRWGGDFKKKDNVHIDTPLNLKDKKRWHQYLIETQNEYFEL